MPGLLALVSHLLGRTEAAPPQPDRPARPTAEADDVRTSFLMNMNHEILTPMNAMLGMADLLWESELTREQRECVAIVRRARGNLTALLNDLLDLSWATPAGRLGGVLARWLMDREDPETTAARQHEARALFSRTEADGMVHLGAHLSRQADDAEVAELETVLAQAVEDLYTRGKPAGGA